jgi:hypothetical protein
MATTEERYKAATEYVRRAVLRVETGAFRTPASLLWPVFATEVYAGRLKTEEVKNELKRIEERWLRAGSDVERARVARDAELLADRTEENLPGAPNDWKRTNLTKGEVARSAPVTSYAQEAVAQTTEVAGGAAGWLKDKAERAKNDVYSIGTLLLIGGGIVLGFKLVDYLREREHRLQRDSQTRARRLLNASLVRTAERNASLSKKRFTPPRSPAYSLRLGRGEIEALHVLRWRYASAAALIDGLVPLDDSADRALGREFDRGEGPYRFQIRAVDVRKTLRATKGDGGDYGAIPNLHSDAVDWVLAEERSRAL